MLDTLSAPAQALLLLGVVTCLGAALIWAFWEMEQASKARRNVNRSG